MTCEACCAVLCLLCALPALAYSQQRALLLLLLRLGVLCTLCVLCVKWGSGRSCREVVVHWGWCGGDVGVGCWDEWVRGWLLLLLLGWWSEGLGERGWVAGRTVPAGTSSAAAVCCER